MQREEGDRIERGERNTLLRAKQSTSMQSRKPFRVWIWEVGVVCFVLILLLWNSGTIGSLPLMAMWTSVAFLFFSLYLIKQIKLSPTSIPVGNKE